MANDDNNVVIDSKSDLDMRLSKTPGVEFMVWCLTGTTSNLKRSRGENDENVRMLERRTKKGIIFFIATKTEAVEDKIIRIIHDIGSAEQNISYIKPRKHRESKDIALAALSQVVKVTTIYNSRPIEKSRLKN